MDETRVDETITDEELTALALAADPDIDVAADAVPIVLTGADGDSGRIHPLPAWYMPVPVGAPRPLRGWRRAVGCVVVASFVLINAYGLCTTYGVVAFG
jgi:hypothetical protein